MIITNVITEQFDSAGKSGYRAADVRRAAAGPEFSCSGVSVPRKKTSGEEKIAKFSSGLLSRKRKKKKYARPLKKKKEGKNSFIGM